MKAVTEIKIGNSRYTPETGQDSQGKNYLSLRSVTGNGSFQKAVDAPHLVRHAQNPEVVEAYRIVRANGYYKNPATNRVLVIYVLANGTIATNE